MNPRSTRRACVAVFALVALNAATPARASDEKKKEVPHSVDLSPVGLPIVWEGKLINYVFVTLKLPVAARFDAAKLREKEPFFRDALVRAAHRTPFVRPWDFTHIDRPALTAVMLRESARIAGEGAVTSIEIVSEEPQRRSGLPQRPAPPKP
ncbi:hypothetical protein BH09PSE2_BH09PSE2_13730 [soil metagenome]